MNPLNLFNPDYRSYDLNDYPLPPESPYDFLRPISTPIIRSTGLSNLHRQYLKKKRVQKSSQCCSICLGQYEAREVVLELPCGHIFHNDRCIKDWFLLESRCPNCRFDVKEYCKGKEREERERRGREGVREVNSTEEQR